MRMLLSFIIISFLMGIVSCSSSKVILNDDYLSGNMKTGNIVVVLRDKTPNIHYDGDVGPEFGEGNQDTLIWQFYKGRLLSEMLLKFNKSKITYDDPVNTFYNSKEELKTRDGNHEITIPAKGSSFQFRNGHQYDMVVFVDDISIGTNLKVTSYMGNNGMVGGTSVSKELSFCSNFVLWDNSQKSMISFGRVDAISSSSFIPVITMSQWESAASKYVRTMFSKIKVPNGITVK